jgi:hypothetical protein
MSDTKIDLPKVAQMFDAGWSIWIRKNALGSYTVYARHEKKAVRERTAVALEKFWNANAKIDCDYDRGFDWDTDGSLMTDDFTPEQALTRMAYKVFGEII